jgi:hypothetical protein
MTSIAICCQWKANARQLLINAPQKREKNSWGSLMCFPGALSSVGHKQDKTVSKFIRCRSHYGLKMTAVVTNPKAQFWNTKAMQVSMKIHSFPFQSNLLAVSYPKKFHSKFLHVTFNLLFPSYLPMRFSPTNCSPEYCL